MPVLGQHKSTEFFILPNAVYSEHVLFDTQPIEVQTAKADSRRNAMETNEHKTTHIAVSLETKHPSTGLAIEEEQPPSRRSSHLRRELFNELEHSWDLSWALTENWGGGG